jgi:tRNA A37 methylthiotransferase MiaB
MRTFCIQTLGCKVNQYESEQIATLLRRRGLIQLHTPDGADIRVINTCSVTIQADSKSRQLVRRTTSLPVLRRVGTAHHDQSEVGGAHPTAPPTVVFSDSPRGSESGQWRAAGQASDVANTMVQSTLHWSDSPEPRARTIVTGCWATSHRAEAAKLAGVDAVITHHDNVAAELERLVENWVSENSANKTREAREPDPIVQLPLQEPSGDELSDNQAGDPARQLQQQIKPHASNSVKKNPVDFVGTHSLPLLDQRDSHHQRAFLKIQDGCDAHCSYCIIPQLRPGLWSKPINDVVEEARRLVDAGHVEIVLTGIFLGAYGQPTALRRRQPGNLRRDTGVPPVREALGVNGRRHGREARITNAPLAQLVRALCTQVRGLKRLRFSSLEPGDLTAELIADLKSHPQVVPHFHLPLQSGSDLILRRMNRQYTRDDFVRMIDDVRDAFDRPAITTDIIVGFPGETDEQYQQTLDVVQRVKFIHIHAFSFSARPGTAAARWTSDFVRGPIVNERINHLAACGLAHSYEFRKRFLGETVELLVERSNPFDTLRHGRCERYFDVWFDAPHSRAGDAVTVKIDRVAPNRTFGCMLPA